MPYAVAAHSGKEVLVPAMPTPMSQKLALPFSLNALFGFAIGVMNIVISAASRPGVGFWPATTGRISVVCKILIPRRLFLLTEQKALNAGLKNIWKYACVFCISARFARRPRRKARSTVRGWRSVTERGHRPVYVSGVSLQPLVFRALDGIVGRLPLKSKDIDDARDVRKAEARHSRPLDGQRKLTSSFGACCQEQRIPSVEMQHGLGITAPVP